MQTFLPFPSFEQTAKVLDYRRLGKQRVEAKQILAILLGETKSSRWTNHPAVKMWEGYEGALAVYGSVICLEWRRRNFRDSLLPYFVERIPKTIVMPSWIGDKAFHESHRSNLMRKDPVHYGQEFKAKDTLPYVWPK